MRSRSAEKRTALPAKPQHFSVRAKSLVTTHGMLRCGFSVWPCALGRSGRRALKKEGDGATPTGTFTLDYVLYRPDRGPRPQTGLPVKPIFRNDGWCDDSLDRNYNRPVKLPYPASTEDLYRKDHLYDLIVVLGYNRRSRVRGKGSAIFLHIARPGLLPTEGCIALSADHVRRILSRCRRGCTITVVR